MCGVCVCVCVCARVCVWLKFERTFSMHSSRALKFLFPAQNTFVSIAKSVLPQHKMRLLLAINTFVCSMISYSEVSNRDYLVTSDKSVHVPCDIKVKQVVFES